MKTALITGITGQDGIYLAQLLLEKGYRVVGTYRRTAVWPLDRAEKIFAHHPKRANLSFEPADLTDGLRLARLVAIIRPDELYNLGAQSHVGLSFSMPEYTLNVDALGTLRVLEAVRLANLESFTKIYHASTSELFGNNPPPQSEETPFDPRSPYAAAKACAFWLVKQYRQAYGMFICNGILFNHESPLRGIDFVTRKIARGAAQYASGLREPLALGNLEARRDWGYAPDYCDAMWRMLQQEKPDDYVVATGISYSVRECVERAFACVGITIAWHGEGIEERGIDAATGTVCITIDPAYFRPNEVEFLCGDARKARAVLDWQPTIGFDELIKRMVEAEQTHVHNLYRAQQEVRQEVAP